MSSEHERITNLRHELVCHECNKKFSLPYNCYLSEYKYSLKINKRKKAFCSYRCYKKAKAALERKRKNK